MSYTGIFNKIGFIPAFRMNENYSCIQVLENFYYRGPILCRPFTKNENKTRSNLLKYMGHMIWNKNMFFSEPNACFIIHKMRRWQIFERNVFLSQRRYVSRKVFPINHSNWPTSRYFSTNIVIPKCSFFSKIFGLIIRPCVRNLIILYHIEVYSYIKILFYITY